MNNRLPAALTLLVSLACPSVGLAQTLTIPPVATISPVDATGAASPKPLMALAAPKAAGFWAPFTSIPSDFVRFMSIDTVKVMGVAGAGALVASRWDHQTMAQARERFSPATFTVGNIGGGFLVQSGAIFGVYAMSRMVGNERMSEVGGDLLRAQILSQGIVQGAKFLTNRPRPDGSNNQSLPSGHTASAFATASVLQRHFGWKVGVPAYGFGAYVAAARMSANKHNLSDVLMGAAVGVAAGHTVTVGRGRTRFAMGVAPTIGGAAVIFSKKDTR